jgi:hypothetical protein
MNTQSTLEPALQPARKRLSSNTWIIIVASALMLGFAIYAAFNWFEIVEDEVQIGAKGEAATNPYFGLQNFLIASGATIVLSNKSRELALGLSDKIAPPQVLMLGDRRLTEMTPARVDSILNWVRAGGHLIVEAEQPTLEDPVLNRYAIDRKHLVWRKGKFVEVTRKAMAENEEAVENAPESVTDENADKAPPTATEDAPPAVPRGFNALRPPKPRATKITLADGTPFTARFEPYQNVLLLPPVPSAPSAKTEAKRQLVKDREGGRLVEIVDGLGRVTVLSNFDLLTFNNLENNDHAELIWHLVSNANRDKPRILVALNKQSDGFWKWMTTHAWMVATSSLVLLLFWLWRVVPRMGPLAVPEAHARRSLLEHMVAAGAFLAKQKQWQALLAPVRSRFIQQYKSRHPRAINMRDADFVQYASRQLQIDENQLARVLFVPVASRHEAMLVLRQLIALFSQLETR